MLTEKSFNTGVVTLNYAEGPLSGQPLMLIHGGSARWHAVEPLIPELAAHWHIYAPDLRGHGKSGRVAGHYRLQDYTDDMAVLLEHCIGEATVIFGHSLGGKVALLVAAQHPNFVRALVIGDSPLSGENWRAVRSATMDRLRNWRDLAASRLSVEEIAVALKDSPVELPGQAIPVSARDMFGDDSPWYRWMATNLSLLDPDMLTAIIDDPEGTDAGFDIDVLLPAIRCPVLLLQADPAHGAAMTDAEVGRALALLARPTHIRLTGVGHPLHATHKEPVLRAMLGFLESL